MCLSFVARDKGLVFIAWKTLLVSCPKVTQARTKMSRNDAPVGVEVPHNHLSVEAQPSQKSPSKRETPADDIKTLTFSTGPQAATGKMVKDRWDHSGGSNGSCLVPFTDQQKSPLQNPDTGETSRGCTISPRTKRGQVDTPIKTVKETVKEVGTKADSRNVGESTRSKSKISHDKIEMENESVDYQQTNEKHPKLTTDKEMERISDESENQSEKSELPLKKAERTSVSRSSNIPIKASQPQAKDSQKHQTTPPNVVSIAELLRSQIKALDSMLANAGGQEPPSIATKTNLKGDEGKRMPGVKTSNRRIEDVPLRNIKETLMEVYQQLRLDQEQLEMQDAVSAAVQPSEIPSPISAVGTGTTAGTNKKMNALCEETGAILVSGLSTSVGQETDTLPPGEHVMSSPGLHIPVLKHTEDKSDLDKHGQFLPKSSSVDGIMAKKETFENLLDPSKTYKLHMDNDVQKVSPDIEQVTHLQANEFNQQASLMVEDFPQTDALVCLSPKSSPLLKRRSHTPHVPAATQQELSSGARRKIPKEKTSPDEVSEAPSPVYNQVQIHNPSTESPSCPASLLSSPSLQKTSQLLQPLSAEQTPSLDTQSPVFSRRKIQPEDPTQSQKTSEETHVQKTEQKPSKKKKHDPFKGRNYVL